MTKPERMTEEAIVKEATSRPFDPKHDLRTWVAEARRARASEEEKDEVIQALADALEDASGDIAATLDHPRNPGSTIGALTQLQARIDAALRAAGRGK